LSGSAACGPSLAIREGDRDNSAMDFMGEAVRLAREGVERGAGGPFGAVVVKDGNVVGAACNRVLEAKDPTAHAEIEAIRLACRELGGFSLQGSELYTTCEPCPMCMGAIHWARIGRVVFALTRRDAARIGFDDEAFFEAMASPRMPVEHVARPDADALMQAWLDKPDRTRY